MENAVKNSSKKQDKSYVVPAVDQASRILITLARHPSGRMTLTEICRAVGIHFSKGFSILSTLQAHHLVHKDPVSKVYTLGMGLIFLSQKVLDNLDLRKESEPFLARITEATGCTAFLGLIVEESFYVAAKDQGRAVVGVAFRLGHRFPLFWGAHGKAILASFPEEERRAILRSGEVRIKDRSPEGDWKALEQELAACDRDGYAVDLEESEQGIRVLASNVFGPTSNLIGAFVVIGTFPQDLVAKFGEFLASEARDFSRLLRGSGTFSP